MRKKNANATISLASFAGVEGWNVKVVIDTAEFRERSSDSIGPLESLRNHCVSESVDGGRTCDRGITGWQGLEKGARARMVSRAPVARVHFGLIRNRARKNG